MGQKKVMCLTMSLIQRPPHPQPHTSTPWHTCTRSSSEYTQARREGEEKKKRQEEEEHEEEQQQQ